MEMTTRDLSMVGVMSALAVAMGYLFIFVPNVEMISATIFLSGWLLGVSRGLMVAVIAEFVYTAFNPMGSSLALPYLMVAQIMGMMVFGFAGGLLGGWGDKFSFGRAKLIMLGATGLVCTILYDLMTTLSWPLAAGFSRNQILATLGLGAIFFSIHIVSNTLIFVIVVPAILRAVKRTGYFR